MFTSPGTAAYQGSLAGKQGVADYASTLLNNSKSLLGGQLNFANMLEPFRQRGIMNQLQAGTPGGAYSQIQSARQGFQGAATASLPAMLQRILSGGGGIGAQQGAGLNATNNATRQGNDLASYYASPAGQAGQAANTAAATANPMPASGWLQQLASLIFGNNQPAPGPSPLGGALGLLGQFLPGLSGGGGGASAANNAGFSTSPGSFGMGYG